MNLFFALLFCVLFNHPSPSTSLENVVNQEDTVYIHKKKELEEAYRKKTPHLIALKHYELGNYYREALLYSEAIEQFYKGLETLPEQDPLRVDLLNSIASMYIAHKNFEKAKTYLERSVVISNKINYQKGLGVAESALGTCFEKKGDYLKALEHQQNSVLIFKALGNNHQIAIVQENIGSIYEDLNQFERALQFFQKSNAYFQEHKSKDQISVLNNLGDVFRKTGKYNEAIKFTTKAINLSKAFNDLDELESAYKDMSKIFVDTENFEKAYMYFLNYDEVKKEALSAKNLKQINTLQSVYEIREKEAQIKLLTKQNEITSANQNLLIGGIFALILISGVLYLNIQRKRRDKYRVQAYEQQLLKTQLDKKAIIEKKLNDEIHLKTASLSKYSLNMAQKNKLIADLSGTLTKIASRPKIEVHQKIKTLVKELNQNLNQSEEWDEFMNYFKEVNPNFFEQLNSIANQNLTTTEYRLAMLLHLKMSSKEIASILRITPDSVRVARYRLRKKLPIQSNIKLVQFLQEFK